MSIRKFVLVFPYNKTLTFETEANLTVTELLLHIQQLEQILGDTNMWNCYSQQRNIQLQGDDEVGDVVDETFIIICQKKNEKPKSITVNIQPQNINIQLKASSLFQVSDLFYYIRLTLQLNENYQNWKCFSEEQNRFLDAFEMLGDTEVENLQIITNKIMIQKRLQIGQNIQSLIEVELNTTISEIFQFAQMQYKLQGDILQWTCYSFQQNQNLDINSTVNEINCELLLITTQNGIFKTENLFQTSFDIFNTNQTLNNTNQLFLQYDQLPLDNQQLILLNIEISEGVLKRQLVLYYSPNTQIEKIANAISKYLSIQLQNLLNNTIIRSQASIDLFINGHQYNNQKDRVQTLYQCGIQNNAIVQARVRWLDTKAYLT